MPGTARNHEPDAVQPAPGHRGRLSWLLVFSLVAAPVGWMTQLLFAFASTSYLCAGATSVVPDWLWPVVALLNFAALALGIAAFAVGVVLLKRATREHRNRSGAVADHGDGRRRFLARWAVFVSLIFVVATLANSFSLFLEPLCKI